VVETVVLAIRDRAVSKQGGEAPVGIFQNPLDTLDVQIRFLLTGKASIREVFSGGRRANRDFCIFPIAVA
jgi:hypothetical protein